ncbi:hypothetical protein [Streptomonospora sediminis]
MDDPRDERGMRHEIGTVPAIGGKTLRGSATTDQAAANILADLRGRQDQRNRRR